MDIFYLNKLQFIAKIRKQELVGFFFFFEKKQDWSYKIFTVRITMLLQEHMNRQTAQ